MQEAARLLRGVKLKASICKGRREVEAQEQQEGPRENQTERTVRGCLYADLLEGMVEEVQQRRQERYASREQVDFSNYRLRREAAKGAFRVAKHGNTKDSIPYDL